MNRQEILDALSAFPYDRSEYWAVTGGAMVLHGVRAGTTDVDLGCSAKLADRLEADGYLYRLQENGRRWFRYGEHIEIFEGWLYGGTETVDGIQVLSLNGLIEMKQALGREKDLKDLALIRAFLDRANADGTRERI